MVEHMSNCSYVIDWKFTLVNFLRVSPPSLPVSIIDQSLEINTQSVSSFALPLYCDKVPGQKKSGHVGPLQVLNFHCLPVDKAN